MPRLGDEIRLIRASACQLTQGIEKRLCLSQIGRIEAFGEANIKGDRRLAGIDSLAVTPDQPRNMKTGIGKKSKPTDIRFYRLNSEALDLRVEAKVLVRPSDLKSGYMSKKGLQRFSDARGPYTDHEIGGMLAYSVTETRTAWLDRIEQALQSAAPPYATFKHRLQSLTEDTLFSHVPYTVKASIRNEVLVFHVVLEFVCDPDARPPSNCGASASAIPA